MVASGLINHGWTYINIDDTWQGQTRRAQTHALQGNDNFPDMKGLCDEIHQAGFEGGHLFDAVDYFLRRSSRGEIQRQSRRRMDAGRLREGCGSITILVKYSFRPALTRKQ